MQMQVQNYDNLIFFFFFNHTSTYYTNNSFSKVAKQFFVDMLGILIKTDWQNRIWRAACKLPSMNVLIYTFIDCGEWSLGELGWWGVGGVERER